MYFHVLLCFQETAPVLVEDISESLEEFQMVLNELVEDESMDKVRVEYEKLIHALKTSRGNEKKLMSKCRELNAEIVTTSTKVAAALKLTQEDEATIASLKRVCYTLDCVKWIFDYSGDVLSDSIHCSVCFTVGAGQSLENG